MRYKNLNANENQDDTTKEFWFQPTGYGTTKTRTKTSTKDTEHKRYNTYDY